MKKILFSGIQPTGELHIGNYLGALKQWAELQNNYNSIFCIVDYHSITEDFEPQKKQEQIFNTAVDLLACGIDAKKSIVFVQSHLPEHTELAWILNCITSVNELERMTQYKDKASRQKHNVNMGLFDYPVLMAADILLYKAELVPVGEDQKQHVELARSIARKFNNKFGKFFLEPRTKFTKAARVMSLTDPSKKMSKSLGVNSYIALSDSPSIIKDKIKSAVTDVGGPGGKVSGGKNLLDLFEQFSNNNPARNATHSVAGGKLINKFQKDYKKGNLKYSELKPALAEAIIKTLKPIQAKRNKLLTNKKYINKILDRGAQQAKKIAEKNMGEIKQKIGIL